MQSYGMRGERERFESYMKMTNYVTSQLAASQKHSESRCSHRVPLKISQQVIFYVSFLEMSDSRRIGKSIQTVCTYAY
jgi:hypothetical protein